MFFKSEISHNYIQGVTCTMLSLPRCRRVQLALTRALLVLQDANRREITRDWQKRERVFRYYLAIGKEIPEKIKTNVSCK